MVDRSENVLEDLFIGGSESAPSAREEKKFRALRSLAVVRNVSRIGTHSPKSGEHQGLAMTAFGSEKHHALKWKNV